MKTLSKWLVGLDLTDYDETVLKFTKQLSDILVPDEVYFIHIHQRASIPTEYLLENSPEMRVLLSIVKEKVFRYFSETTAIKCEVFEGTPEFDLWRESYLHHSDLVLLGEREGQIHRKVVHEKFLKKAFSSVLFITPESKIPRHIWVPIEYHDTSKESVELACAIASKIKEGKITVQRVLESPSLELIKPELREEYKRYLEKQENQLLDTFLREVNCLVKTDVVMTPWVYAEAADHIYEAAESSGADMILMSAGGKSRLTSLFLGSTTQSLVKIDKTIPLLVLKNKISRVKAWDILTNL